MTKRSLATKIVAAMVLAAIGLVLVGAKHTNGDRIFDGFLDLSGGSVKFPETTYASLPAAAGVTGRVYMVTDGLNNSCSAGGGTTRCGVRSTGSAYECVWNCSTTATVYNQTIQDETVDLTQRAKLNFAGAGVTCADATTVTTCTIPGGSSSGYTSQRLIFYVSGLVSSTTATYYQGFTNGPGTIQATVNNAQNTSVIVPITGAIKAVNVTAYDSATHTGIAGDGRIALCINGGTAGSCNGGTTLTVINGWSIPNATFQRTFVSGLNQSVTANSDKIIIEVIPGTYTTNAILSMWVDIYYQ